MRRRDREPVVSLPSFGALEFLDTPLGSEIPLQPELATRISTARAHVAHDTAFTSFTLVGVFPQHGAVHAGTEPTTKARGEAELHAILGFTSPKTVSHTT